MISFCITCYNSADTVDEFMKAFDGLTFPHEIIFVDNFSKDGTYERLKKYEKENVRILQKKCTRGKGRDIGIELARYDHIVILDIDVSYCNLDQKIQELLDKYGDDFVLSSGTDKGSLMTFFPKSLITLMGGFPDFNYGEDVYIWNIAKKLGRFVRDPEDQNIAKNIVRQEFSNDISTERRYERNIARLFMRRVFITRDIIFVYDVNYRELLNFYRVKDDTRKKLITAILYMLGKVLSFFITIPKSDEKAREIMARASNIPDQK